jgi:hypothetical protein
MGLKTGKLCLVTSIEAGEKLATANVFIKLDGKVAGTNAIVYGVLQDATEDGQMAPVALFGEVLVLSGGVVTAGDYITSNASGKAIPCPARGTGYIPENIAGRAVDAASGVDELIRVRIPA